MTVMVLGMVAMVMMMLMVFMVMVMLMVPTHGRNAELPLLEDVGDAVEILVRAHDEDIRTPIVVQVKANDGHVLRGTFGMVAMVMMMMMMLMVVMVMMMMLMVVMRRCCDCGCYRCRCEGRGCGRGVGR